MAGYIQKPAAVGAAPNQLCFSARRGHVWTSKLPLLQPWSAAYVSVSTPASFRCFMGPTHTYTQYYSCSLVGWTPCPCQDGCEMPPPRLCYACMHTTLVTTCKSPSSQQIPGDAIVYQPLHSCACPECSWEDPLQANAHDKATVDHVVALANGGPNTFSNMVVSCYPCNARKGAR